MVAAGCTNQETTQENSLIDSNATETGSEVENTDDTSASEESSDEADLTEDNSDEKDVDEEAAIIPQNELDNALSKKNSIDIKATEAEVETISLEPESESWEPRVLKQYLDNDEILKMTVTEPTDAGKMTGLTTYYYDQGELFFVRIIICQLYNLRAESLLYGLTKITLFLTCLMKTEKKTRSSGRLFSQLPGNVRY